MERSPAGNVAVVALVVVCIASVVGLGAYVFLAPQPVASSQDAQHIHALREQVSRLADRLESMERDMDMVLLTSTLRREENPSPELAHATLPDDTAPANGAERAEPDSSNGRGGGRGNFTRLDDIEDPTLRLAKAREMADSGNPWDQMQAFSVLLELAPREAVDMVTAMVANMDPNSRMGRMAGFSVARLGDVEGIDISADLRKLYESESPDVKISAARALEKQGDNSLMRTEVASLSVNLSSQDGGLRGYAVEDLGRTGSALATPLLLPMLSDSNSEVRLKTLDALGRTANESVIPEVQALLNDPVERVRERAERTLSRLRDPEPSNPFDRMRGGFGGGDPRGGRGGR